MELAHVDGEVYITMACKEFISIRTTSMRTNLYTLVRACAKAAEIYSYQVSHLHRGGMAELIMVALNDVIEKLHNEKRMNDDTYAELKRQYQRDVSGPLPDVISEMMQIQGASPLRSRR